MIPIVCTDDHRHARLDRATSRATHYLAAHFGYSPCYCSAQLRAHLNVPFRIYLTSRRLASAAEALRMTNRRILDIAVQYGFSSHESFAHAFRRAYGRTPSSYRQQFRHGSRKKAIS
ncbi:MAG: helix-turn-helix transcriptional regulator [Acutalibacteraceae bacterium]|nr:helix-turn-helix transcriptional regulator [Clostridiales bacterium]